MKIKKNGKIVRLTESDLKKIVKRVLTEQDETPSYKQGDVITFIVSDYADVEGMNTGDEVKFKIFKATPDYIYGAYCDREGRLSCTASLGEWQSFEKEGRGYHGNDKFLQFNLEDHWGAYDGDGWCAEGGMYTDEFCGIIKK